MSSLTSILRRGIGLQLEIMPEPSADALAETLVAFANGDGGTVLLGVDANGQVLGTLQPEDAESLLRAALSQCRPLVRTDWQAFEKFLRCARICSMIAQRLYHYVLSFQIS